MDTVSPIRAIRQRLNLSQKDMASGIGISQTTLSGYERGDWEISPAVARKLVATARDSGLQITMDQVYGLAPLEAVHEAG